MADTKISALTNYTAPIGADIVPIVDTVNSTTKGITLQTLHAIYTNASTAQQGSGFATDTYLTGSSINIPSGAPYVGTTYHLIFDVVKTAVGTATPILTLRIGTLGTTGDTARCTFTFGAGTAAADTGQFEIWASFRTVGSGTSAVLAGRADLTSNLQTTGLSNAVKCVTSISSGFDSTTASSIIGVSYNGGASAVHTVQLVRAELIL
jgi:hypothetical protein